MLQVSNPDCLEEELVVGETTPLPLVVECFFPITVVGAFSVMSAVVVPGGLMELLLGTTQEVSFGLHVTPALADTLGSTLECDNGIPFDAILSETEPLYDDPSGAPCFRHVDGRRLAWQCRCRTLNIAGNGELAEGFAAFLQDFGVVDIINNFTEQWRDNAPGTCPEYPTTRLGFAEIRDEQDCALVNFRSDSDVQITADITSDASVFRPTLSVVQSEAKMEEMWSAKLCSDVESSIAFPCTDMYELVQSHALADLQYFANVFLARRGNTDIDPLFDGLAGNISLSLYQLPIANGTTTDISGNTITVESLGAFIGFVFGFPFIFWVCTLIYLLVGEREKKQKEGMRVMGLIDKNFYISWLSWMILKGGFIAVVIGLIALIFWPTDVRGFGLVTIIFFLGSLYTYAFSGVISTLVANERVGSMIGAMLFFMFMMPAIIVVLRELPILIYILMWFPSYWIVTALKHALYVISRDWREGLTLEGWTLSDVMLVGFLAVPSWYLLYLYLDMVVPQKVGTPRHPLFLFMPSFWREACPSFISDRFPSSSLYSKPLAARFKDDETENTALVQKLQDPTLAAHRDAGRCVEICDLEVHFTGVHGELIRAVDGLSLCMYPDEIFVLLGHNGAGKTTTIGVLSGMVMSTGGSVTIFGKRVPQDLWAVRQSLGVCPQHNVLWDDLTCLEHMDFFVAIRQQDAGGKAARLAQATELLSELGMGKRMKYRSGELSGGMKRKLSVAIAFNGLPDFVILDEPTSGMDPFSRRALWDFMKHRRAGRVVLLTTHFMDEADVLGDRVAVMANGRLQAYGDAQFLKRNCGCGYVLTVIVKEPEDGDESTREDFKLRLREAVLRVVAGVEGVVVQAVSKELLILVPSTVSGCIPQLLTLLEESRSPDSQIPVATYGVTVSSLEEVFLKLASGAVRPGNVKPGDEGKRLIDRIAAGVSKVKLPARQRHGEPTSPKQKKKEAWAETSPVTASIVPPSSSVESESVEADLATERGLNLGETEENRRHEEAEAEAEPEEPNVETSEEDVLTSLDIKPMSNVREDFFAQCGALFVRRFRFMLRDQRSFALTCCVPVATLGVMLAVLAIVLGILPSTSFEVFADVPVVEASRVLWSGHADFPFPNVPSDQFFGISDEARDAVVLNTTLSFTTQRVPQDPVIWVRPSQENGLRNVPPPADYCNRVFNVSLGIDAIDLPVACVERWQQTLAVFLEKLVEEIGRWDAAVLSIDGHFVVFTADSKFIHAISSSISAMMSTVSGNTVNIGMGAKVREPEVGDGAIRISSNQILEYIMPVIILSVAFSFIPTGVVQFAMMEKVNGVKSQLFISGCTYRAYWLSNLVWDVTFGMFPVIVCAVFFWGFGYPQFQGKLGWVIIQMVLFVPGACGFSYVFSQVVASEALGTTLCLALNGLIGTLLVLTVIVGDTYVALITFVYASTSPTTFLDNINNDPALSIMQTLSDICSALGMMLPGFSLASGILKMSLRQLFIFELLPSILSFDQVVDLVNDLLIGGFDATADLLPDTFSFVGLNSTDTDVSTLVDENILPPLQHIISLQGCYVGATRLAVSNAFFEADPATVTVACDGIRDPNSSFETGIGTIVESLVSLFTLGDNIMHSLTLALMWPLLAILVEAAIQSPRISEFFVPKDPMPKALMETNPDPDVKIEKERVVALSSDKQIILVRNLHRCYKRPNQLLVGVCFALLIAEVSVLLANRMSFYVIAAVNLPLGILFVCLARWIVPMFYYGVKTATHAVREVSWASDTGMVFGLLGVNGAGKTSTFEMMSGLRTPSHGEVKIVGMDISSQVEACRRYIGYCPQFDCILPLLTPHDHLLLFGRIKGLSGPALTTAVESCLERLQLAGYRDRYAGTLSGGNKRKLCVAQALIGEPPIIFLDEPSTGMDPFARRFMWKVIDDVAETRKKSVVVLTTHSMEEGEALCSKIAIQVDGHLKCFGSTQRIKEVYGTGYEVPLKFKPLTAEMLEHQMSVFADLKREMDDPVTREEVHAALHNAYPEKETRTGDYGAPFSHGVESVPFTVMVDWWVLDDLVHALGRFLLLVSGTKHGLVLEHHGLSARFRLPDLLDPSKLPNIFKALLADDNFNIEDFGVCQSSLEQVFNQFARTSAVSGDQEADGTAKKHCSVQLQCGRPLLAGGTEEQINKFEVTVEHGHAPGQTVEVNPPFTQGKPVSVQIPDGAAVGDKFVVRVPYPESFEVTVSAADLKRREMTVAPPWQPDRQFLVHLPPDTEAGHPFVVNVPRSDTPSSTSSVSGGTPPAVVVTAAPEPAPAVLGATS
eukprot:CAMPEP_0194544054 /NCGR_PEP_ID=MMETSP0253-20130528/86847_1 /TAXON_ID=2966 /ORGANISM="Noctiluca scintillans" /LENGTH=2283 /DNA_ID=CAMNT_0039390883 /DNA_START=1 /DNA_END=6853 /DNA_ORIENTATION=+